MPCWQAEIVPASMVILPDSIGTHSLGTDAITQSFGNI